MEHFDVFITSLFASHSGNRLHFPHRYISPFQRFVTNDFSSEHVRSTAKKEYFPTLVLNDSVFELKVTDLPPLPFFPESTDAEWAHFRFYGLRTAAAYLLVYDAAAPSATFQVSKETQTCAKSGDYSSHYFK